MESNIYYVYVRVLRQKKNIEKKQMWNLSGINELKLDKIERKKKMNNALQTVFKMIDVK